MSFWTTTKNNRITEGLRCPDHFSEIRDHFVSIEKLHVLNQLSNLRRFNVLHILCPGRNKRIVIHLLTQYVSQKNSFTYHIMNTDHCGKVHRVYIVHSVVRYLVGVLLFSLLNWLLVLLLHHKGKDSSSEEPKGLDLHIVNLGQSFQNSKNNYRVFFFLSLVSIRKIGVYVQK